MLGAKCLLLFDGELRVNGKVTLLVAWGAACDGTVQIKFDGYGDGSGALLSCFLSLRTAPKLLVSVSSPKSRWMMIWVQQ